MVTEAVRERAVGMATETRRDIEETLGLVPEFFDRVPDYLLPTEWASFKSLQLSDETALPNKYKELIGLAVSGAPGVATARTSTPRRPGCSARRRTRSTRRR
jgi:alkylhydroperoxidase/carboxymuconolactone decarboxylase family protein YurZ